MSAPNPCILPGHLIRSYYQSVSGPIDSTYQLLWGTDTYSARPVKATSGTAAYVIGVAGGNVNFASIVNSNVTVATTVSGAFATLGTPLVGPDEVPKNPWAYLETPISVGSVTFTISGNPDIVTIGEFIVGEAFTLERPFPPGSERTFDARRTERNDTWGFIPAVDENAKSRKISTTLRVTQSECDNLEAMWEGQRATSLPSLIVPRPDRNDAWYGRLTGFSYRRLGPNDFEVPFNFEEHAMCRW